MNANSLRAALIAALATLALAGCDRDGGRPHRRARSSTTPSTARSRSSPRPARRRQQKLAGGGRQDAVGARQRRRQDRRAGDKIAQKTGEAAVAAQEATVGPVSSTAPPEPARC